MKKRLAMLLVLVLTFSLAACSGGGDDLDSAGTTKSAEDEAEGDAAEDDQKLETDVIRWNAGTSGNVLLTIAEEKGYFEDAGLTIEYVEADANADAMTLLATGKVDIVSNAGTSNPLQQIASGMDFTVFGGHMINGCMPIVAKAGTKLNGVEDLIGKKFACNPSYFALTGAVMDLGYDDPLSAVEWVTYTDYNDALAAIVRGEVDYALMGTGQNYTVENMEDVDIMCYQSDIMPNYSCCRMVAQTEFAEQNPVALKAVMKVLLRAQCYYEANKEEAVTLHAKKINAEEDYVAAYMLNEHYYVSVDPLENSVVKAWEILGKTGFLDENAKEIDISDHVNTELYEEALAEATAEYGDDDPEFYENMKTFYEENNN